MKNLLLALFVLVSLSTHAGTILVSDLDDTIKITNSGREVDGTINALFSKDVFTGIPEFLQGMRDYVDEVHVLSASPTILRNKVLKTFEEKEIEVDSLILKNYLRGQSKIAYKVEEIVKLLQTNPSDELILIGDDVGQDPEVFDEIQRHYPHRVIASYIHVINGRSVPKSSIRYWTTLDLLIREHMAGRMLQSRVEEGFQKILEEEKPELIFPDFADCPKTPAVWLWQLRSGFVKQATEVVKKLNRYCLAGRSAIILP